jgi:hypothetical protein
MLAIGLTETAYTGFRTQKLRQNQHFLHAIAQKTPVQAIFATRRTPVSSATESPVARVYSHNFPDGTAILR